MFPVQIGEGTLGAALLSPQPWPKPHHNSGGALTKEALPCAVCKIERVRRSKVKDHGRSCGGTEAHDVLI